MPTKDPFDLLPHVDDGTSLHDIAEQIQRSRRDRQVSRVLKILAVVVVALVVLVLLAASGLRPSSITALWTDQYLVVQIAIIANTLMLVYQVTMLFVGPGSEHDRLMGVVVQNSLVLVGLFVVGTILYSNDVLSGSFFSSGASTRKEYKTPGQVSAETAKTNWAVDVDQLTAGAPSERDAQMRARKAKPTSPPIEGDCIDSRLFGLTHPWVKTNYRLEDRPLIIRLTKYTMAASHSQPCGVSGCPEQRTPGILPNAQVPHMLALANVGGMVIPMYDGLARLDPSKLGSGEISVSVHQVIKQEVGNLDADNEWRQMRGEYCYEVRYAEAK